MKIFVFLLWCVTSFCLAQERVVQKPVFSKDQTLIRLINKELRQHKWKNFEWKIDGDKTFKIITEFEDQLPDIEPLKITVLGVDKFKMPGDEVVDFAGLVSVISQYEMMAKSSGSQPYYALSPDKLTADQGYRLLVKFYNAGVRKFYFARPEVEIPVKPPVNRRPPSPHKTILKTTLES